jgi:hypothetical protein
MRNPQGYSILCTEYGEIRECDTFTCNHCSYVVMVAPRMKPEEMGGFCKVCMGLICKDCYDQVMKGAGCSPWLKKLETIEAKDRFLRQCGL